MIKKSRFKIKQRKASKTYICSNCYDKIPVNSIYNTQTYYLKGRFGVNKYHIDCGHIFRIYISILKFFKTIFKIKTI